MTVAIVGAIAVLLLIAVPVAAETPEVPVVTYHPTPIDPGEGFSGAYDLVLGPDARLWFPAPGGLGGNIAALAIDGGIEWFALADGDRVGAVDSDTRMVVGPDEALWFTEWGPGHDALGRFDVESGTYRQVAVPAETQPKGIAAARGRVWYAGFLSKTLGWLEPGDPADTQAWPQGSFALPAGTGNPTPLVVDPADRGVWVGAAGPNQVLLVGWDGAPIETIDLQFEIKDLAVADGRVWAAGGTDSVVVRLDDPAREYRTPSFATGLAFDTMGRLWIASGSDVVGATIDVMTFTADQGGGLPTPAPTPALQGDGYIVQQLPIGDGSTSPTAVALGADDQVWFIEKSRDVVGRAWTDVPVAAPAAPSSDWQSGTLIRVLHGPDEVFTVRNVAYTLPIILCLYLLLVLPATLVNSAIEANRERLQARPPFSWGRGLPAWATRGSLALLALVAIAALIYTVPAFAQRLESTPLVFIALAVGIFVPAGLQVLIADGRFRSATGGAVASTFPVSLVLAVLCVIVSVWAGFTVLFAYGVVATWIAARVGQEKGIRQAGVVHRDAGIVVLLVALAAWVLMWGLRIPGDTPLHALLEGLLLVGLEVLMLGMIPLAYLPGGELRAWSRSERLLPWWLLYFLAGTGLFVLVIIGPGLATFEAPSLIALAVVAVAFAVTAGAFYLGLRLTDPARRPKAAVPDDAPPALD
jgi:hypothetical protein